MSGLEVAGLVIGVVPIVVEILKSYSVTKDRLKTFAHSAQVVYDVQLRYRVAATNFSNDCQLLLKAVVDDTHELSAMVDDPNHSSWQDPVLEERFRNFLERDYQLCEEIVVRIRDALRGTQTRLSELHADRKEPREKQIQRLYRAFNISLKENQYRKYLEVLDQWNNKLGNLRAQRCKLQKRHNFRSDGLVRKSVPRQYSDIRNASQRLYDSLKDSWSCTNVSHIGHQAKLSLDAKAEYGTARLDMVIACRRRPPLSNRMPPSEAPIWLHVQSITTNDTTSNRTQNSPVLTNTLFNTFQPMASPSSASASGSVVRTVKRTLKRVRFDGISDKDASLDSPQAKSHGPMNASTDTEALSFAMLDLKATQSVCCHLTQACLSSTCKDTCLGYLEILEVPHSFKLIFYDAGRNTDVRAAQQSASRKSYSINETLQNLQILHQLTLAHRLATATLQYHSTSWLPQDWDLRDIAYFTDTAKTTEDDIDIAKRLQTLHLSTQFPPEATAVLSRSDQDPEHLKYMYGIRNMTLAKLGVALLEIGLKKDISTVLDGMPHRIIKARRFLLGDTSALDMLGKRYVRIARKCVDCDFSSGDSLDEDALRSAVYTDVVCALDDMIEDWKKFLGIK